MTAYVFEYSYCGPNQNSERWIDYDHVAVIDEHEEDIMPSSRDLQLVVNDIATKTMFTGGTKEECIEWLERNYPELREGDDEDGDCTFKLQRERWTEGLSCDHYYECMVEELSANSTNEDIENFVAECAADVLSEYDAILDEPAVHDMAIDHVNELREEDED